MTTDNSTKKESDTKDFDENMAEKIKEMILPLQQAVDSLCAKFENFESKWKDQLEDSSSRNELLNSQKECEILKAKNEKIQQALSSKEDELNSVRQELERTRTQWTQAEKTAAETLKEKEQLTIEKTGQIDLLQNELQQERERNGELTECQNRLKSLNFGMIEDAVDMINQYENLSRIPEECREYVSNVVDLLYELLIHGGLEPFENETSFNSLRHQSVPRRVVLDGTPIVKTIEPGLQLGPKVYVRAKVEVVSEP